MRKVLCEQKHYFDADRFQTCPVCGSPPASEVPSQKESLSQLPLQQGGGSIPNPDLTQLVYEPDDDARWRMGLFQRSDKKKQQQQNQWASQPQWNSQPEQGSAQPTWEQPNQGPTQPVWEQPNQGSTQPIWEQPNQGSTQPLWNNRQQTAGNQQQNGIQQWDWQSVVEQQQREQQQREQQQREQQQREQQQREQQQREQQQREQQQREQQQREQQQREQQQREQQQREQQQREQQKAASRPAKPSASADSIKEPAKPKSGSSAALEKTKVVYDDYGNPPVGWLVCVKGDHAGEAFECITGRNRIGRNRDYEIPILADRTVSRSVHATIIYEPKSRKFFIQAGGGDGLVYKNDDILFGHEELNLYDKITLGKAEFVFVPLCGESFTWDDYLEDNV